MTRQIRPGTSQGTLAFLFGVFATREVPGRVLVHALGDLGVTPGAARTLTSRLSASGDLGVRRVGRQAVYRLEGTLLRNFEAVQSGRAPHAWEGSFACVLYDIDERRRPSRDDLRREAHLRGFGSPRPGVLIGFEDTGWADAWRTPGTLVEASRLACDLATARRLAEAAWGVREHHARLTRARDTLRARAADPGPAPQGVEALRALHALWNAHADLLIGVPWLPVALLPGDWPADELARLTRRVDAHLLPGARAHLETILAAHPAAAGLLAADTAD